MHSNPNCRAACEPSLFTEFLHSFDPTPPPPCKIRFVMKIHLLIQSTVAALALAFISNTPAQTAPPAPTPAKDPFAAGTAAAPAPAPAQAPAAQDESAESKNISLACEAFSLPIVKAGEIQRSGLTDAKLYDELVAAGKLERLLVVRTKSGQRVALNNVTEYRFPAEFAPPQIPGDFSKKTGEPNQMAPAVQLPIAVTAFDKVEVGDVIEVEPICSMDAKTVDFQISVSHVALAKRDKWGQGLAEEEQPQFESQKLNTNITASVGSPRFIGTLNAPFGNGLTTRAEQNIWFCFITAKLTENMAGAQKNDAR